MSKMFSFITVSNFNPLGGECLHNCSYGWCKRLIKQYNMKKYQGPPFIDEKQLKRVFKPTDFVFVCDMCDLFGDWVPTAMIQRVLDYIAKSPATFLLLTKNPKRYKEFSLPSNCVAGATVEHNWTACGYGGKAPSPLIRMIHMEELQFDRKLIVIEPCMNWTLGFEEWLLRIKPWAVAIGYDNYGNNLSEPSLEKVMQLIECLERAGIKVYRKTLREKREIQY